MEILNKNPAEKITLPRHKTVNVKKDIKYYNFDDLNILLDYLSEYKPQRFSEYNVYYVLVYFLSRTGLRISEALALKWSDVQQNRLDVNKQTSRDDNNRLTISTLKNNPSYRNIELDKNIVELLSDFRRLQNKMILKHEKFIRNKDMIIFQTYNGNYMTPSTTRHDKKSLF
ncbi:tyrosine-type recombinase/integrase [Pseudogracilibacillus sp. SO30301A]